jgi:hypothetical protein
MTYDEQQRFALEFIEMYLSMGFGSLPKREIDLFVFNYLINSSEYKNKSNYDLANAFKIPESKIKTLKLNSALKYREFDTQSILGHLVNRLINSDQFATLTENKIEISIEDPLEKRELENFLKSRGYYAEYTLNNEILKISLPNLLELIFEHTENANQEIEKIIQECILDKNVSENILSNAKTLGQKIENIRKESLNIDTLKQLIIAALPCLIKLGS